MIPADILAAIDLDCTRYRERRIRAAERKYQVKPERLGRNWQRFQIVLEGRIGGLTYKQIGKNCGVSGGRISDHMNYVTFVFKRWPDNLPENIQRLARKCAELGRLQVNYLDDSGNRNKERPYRASGKMP